MAIWELWVGRKCSAWSCWAEVNNPGAVGRERLQCQPRVLLGSARCWEVRGIFFFFLGFVGGQADTARAVLPRAAISPRAFELWSSLWPLLVEPAGRAGK